MTNSNTFVKLTNKGKSVFASRDFRKNETVVIGNRLRISPERTSHSFQIDVDLHVELDEPAVLINHSCTPNTGVRNNRFGGYDFVALVDIVGGDEITWDYETTEYISIAVAKCYCGSSACRSKTSGFKYLPHEIRNRYGEFIADYLKVSSHQDLSHNEAKNQVMVGVHN